MSSSRRMDHMTWPEIEASKSKPVIVPIGSTEQHSQHLPLGVDAMIASHVSEDLAVTVINQMHDVLGELIADGFTKIVVMNAHFENEAFIIEAIDLITRETRGVATIVETNWWDPLPENVVEQVFDGLVFPGWALEHAAVTETSLMMHYEPELVHMDRVIDEGNVTPKAYVRYPVRKGDVPDYGGLATPAGSSAERGKLIVDACIDAVADICATEFGE